MKKLIKKLSSKEVLYSIPFVGALAIAVIALLSYWQKGEFILWLLILGGIIVIAGIVGWVWWLRRLRKKKIQRNESIAEEMLARTQRDAANVKPEKRAELESLAKNFAEGVKYLQDRGVGLSELPWYMVIGPPGHGKTTLIRESGFDFAGFKTRADYKDATRNCGWFFSDDAVIIDTAGRYAAGEQVEASNEEWVGLLKMIKDQRPDRPINGILVALNITDFKGDSSQPRIKQYAESLRARVLEVMEVLGVRVPVYVVFTMSDVMAGFASFFHGLSLKERDQWWGVTLEPNKTTPPGEVSSFDAGQIFEEAFREFYERLLNRRLHLFSMRQNREMRHDIALFLKNITDIRMNLKLFSERLFHTSRYEEDFLFRGFYFTSGTQTERPAVDLTQSLSSILGLSGESEEPASPQQSGFAFPEKEGAQSFFVKELFANVVIPDETLAELTTEEARRRKKLSGASVIGSGAVALLCSVLFIGSCSQSRSHVSAYNNSINELKKISFDGLPNIYERTQVLGQSTGLLKASYHEAQAISNRWPNLGINRAVEVLDTLQMHHHRIVMGILEPFYSDSLSVTVNKIAETTDAANLPDDAINGLRTYVLLGSNEHYAEFQKAEEQRRLKKYLNSVLNKLLSQVQDSTENISEVLQLMVADFVTLQAEKTEPPFDHEDNPDIANAFAQLGQDVNEATITREFKHALADSVEEINGWKVITVPELLKVEDGSDEIAEMFSGSATLDAAYAGLAWEKREDVLDEVLARKLGAKGDWFDERQLGNGSANSTDESRASTISKYKVEILPAYEKSFYREWDKFVGRVQVSTFRDLEDAEEMMELLSKVPDEESALLDKILEVLPGDERLKMNVPLPLFALFNVISEHTSDFHEYGQANSVHNLKFIHDLYADAALVDGWGEIAQHYKNIMQDLRGMDEDKALEVAKDVLGSSKGSIYDAHFYVHEEFKEKLEDVPGAENIDGLVDNLLINPIIEVWEQVLIASGPEINNRWEEVVWRKYNDEFRDFYPFDLNSENPVSYSNFKTFFDSEFTEFIEKEIGVFIDNIGTSSIKAKIWPYGAYGKSMNFNMKAFNSINAALRIGDTIEYTVVLNPKATSDDHIVIRVDGDNIVDFNDKRFDKSNYRFDGSSSRVEYVLKKRGARRKDDVIPVGNGVWAFIEFVYSNKNIENGVYRFTAPDEENRTYSIEMAVDQKSNPLSYKGFYSSFSPDRKILNED